VIILGFVPLLAKQLLEFTSGDGRSSIASKYSYLPEVTLYSSFDSSLALWYSLTMAVFLILGIVGYMMKWSNYDKADKF